MSIEGLRNKINASVSPGDVVLAILQELPNQDITTDQQKLDKVFYELSKESKYRELLKDFVFDLSDFSPRCRMLETLLDSLSGALKLETKNILAKEYRIKDAVRRPSVRKYIENLFNENDRELIKEMAGKVAAELDRAA